MRIKLDQIDPASALARRIQAALARDMAIATPNSAAGGQSSSGSARGAQNCSAASSSPRCRSEEALQRAVMTRLATEAVPGVVAFHVPNGGKRGKAEAGRLKAMGTLAGVPDILIVARGRLFGLELKTERGRLSAA